MPNHWQPGALIGAEIKKIEGQNEYSNSEPDDEDDSDQEQMHLDRPGNMGGAAFEPTILQASNYPMNLD